MRENECENWMKNELGKSNTNNRRKIERKEVRETRGRGNGGARREEAGGEEARERGNERAGGEGWRQGNVGVRRRGRMSE